MRILGLSCLACILFVATPLSAQNCTCLPARNGAVIEGTRTIFIQSGFTSTDRNNIIAGFEEWTAAMVDRLNPINWDYTDSTSADIIVRIGSSTMPPETGATTNKDGWGRGVITFNPRYLGQNLALVWHMAAHESGHMLNFGHSTCTARDSVMYGSVNANGPFPGVTCADIAAVKKVYQRDDSPILVSLKGDPLRFSSIENGVLFDLRAVGVRDQVSWPVGCECGFLVLDRNGNGQVDSGAEMFGNNTPLADGSVADNGFHALSEFDRNGDGWVDRVDPGFGLLRIWIDQNRNGQSEPEELHLLDSVGLEALSLDYHLSDRVDGWGNRFRYKARARASGEAAPFLWDVYLVWSPVF